MAASACTAVHTERGIHGIFVVVVIVVVVVYLVEVLIVKCALVETRRLPLAASPSKARQSGCSRRKRKRTGLRSPRNRPSRSARRERHRCGCTLAASRTPVCSASVSSFFGWLVLVCLGLSWFVWTSLFSLSWECLPPLAWQSTDRSCSSRCPFWRSLGGCGMSTANATISATSLAVWLCRRSHQTKGVTGNDNYSLLQVSHRCLSHSGGWGACVLWCLVRGRVVLNFSTSFFFSGKSAASHQGSK